MPRSARERALVVLLRFGGVLLLTATFAAALPRETMDAICRWLGMGPLPAPPLTDYLARSTSLLYAIHGGLLLLTATDVRRYRPFVLFFGWSDIAFGLALAGVHLAAGMPTWWTLVEVPWIVAVGVLLLWLARGLPPADP